MNFFSQIPVLFIVVQWCSEVKCMPHIRKKHSIKYFQIGLFPLPERHAFFTYEKITPFEAFDFKHSIKKRQAVDNLLPPPVENEVHAVEDVSSVGKLPPEVIINTVIEPLEPGKQISFLLPVDSEVVITPAVKEVAASVPPAPEGVISPEPGVKIEEVPPISVIEITPKPIQFQKPVSVIPSPPIEVPSPHVEIPPPAPEILPPPILLQPEVQPIEPKVPAVTPIENIAPLLPPVPVFENSNIPYIGPLINRVPVAPFLYTNINRLPFYSPTNIVPFLTPGAIPIPEPIIPPAPLPTNIPPNVVREEAPNFLVKSSRFVLYFGSMMLQMLSQFVNGRSNANPIALPPPLLGVQ